MAVGAAQRRLVEFVGAEALKLEVVTGRFQRAHLAGEIRAHEGQRRLLDAAAVQAERDAGRP